jgi:hypothetical protein
MVVWTFSSDSRPLHPVPTSFITWARTVGPGTSERRRTVAIRLAGASRKKATLGRSGLLARQEVPDGEAVHVG